MFQKLFQFLSITCRHRKLSKPFAVDFQHANGPACDPAISHYAHYVVCLECGKKFGYDWQEMRVVKEKVGLIA